MTSTSSDRREPHSLRGYVDYAALSSADHLLIAGWSYPGFETLEVAIDGVIGARAEMNLVRGARPDVSASCGRSDGALLGFVASIRLATPVTPDQKLALVLKSGWRSLTLPLDRAAGASASLVDSVRGYAAPQRAAAARLAHAVLAPDEIDALTAGGPTVIGSIRIHVEHAARAGTSGVYLRGWLADPDAELVAMRVRAAGATSGDVSAGLGRIERPDVDRALGTEASRSGLLCFVPIQVPRELETAELVVTTRTAEVVMPLELAALPTRPLGLSRDLLADFDPFRAGSVELLERHIGPALEAAWQPRDDTRDVRVFDAGPRPQVAIRSVVIPLFGRADFMLYQVNEFARDRDFEETELIYVIDDPSLGDEAVALARSLYQLHGLPLRVVDGGRNRGFAGATNLGARHANGRYLVLLNSDVLPSRAGWMSRLCYKLRELDDAGPIAPRLLFHDSTVQHDGIAFRRDPAWPGIWLNDHPGKGLPASLLRGPALERVPAVSAACMLLERELYQELGGLDEHYLIGDYEDSDLCLRAAERGRMSYVVRDETLFHLERQSQSLAGAGAWRLKLTLYNAWRHGRIWADQIARAASAEAAP